MNPTRTCPKCQQALPADAPEGLCPACVMQNLAATQPGDRTEILPPGSTPAQRVDIADPAEIAKRLPQFEIIELLGRGGMGVVYKARQPQLDRVVALKILPPEDSVQPDFVERFRREARSLAKLNHPNIVTVHDFGESDGLYYFLMEFVDGANLRQLLQSKKLTADEALAIVPKVCDALEYAHEEGVVHRDIKPENILIDKKGRVKIADFGLAKLLRREALDMTLTLAGSTLGTLRYMAPEQMDKPESVDHRADIYSLGVVFYEMLTGDTPVGRFALPSQKASVDTRLDEIVLHAIEREPEKRYQHASEVKTDVENVTSKPMPAASPAMAGSAPVQKPSGSPSVELHPKIETARRMGFWRWVMRWLFAVRPGPCEWRMVMRPILVVVVIIGAVVGVDIVHFGVLRSLAGSWATAAPLGLLIIIGLVLALQLCGLRRLWRHYRSGEPVEDAVRIPMREIPADIRHGMGLRTVVALLGLVVVAWFVLGMLSPFTTFSMTGTTPYRLAPHSKQYPELVLTPGFESFMKLGRTYHKRPAEWEMGMSVQPKSGGKPMTMTVKFPSLRASYWHPRHTPESYYESVLDLSNLSEWMRERCGVEMNDEAQGEARQIMAMLKDFREKPPACFSEFLERVPVVMTSFTNTGWGGGSFAGNLTSIAGWQVLFFAVAVPLALTILLGLIDSHGQRLARERLSGAPSSFNSEAARRVRLRELPPDIHSTAWVRFAWATLGFLLAFGMVVAAMISQPVVTKHTYNVALQPKSPSWQKLELQFDFPICDWRDSRYDVQSDRFPLTLRLTLNDGAPREVALEGTSLEARYTPQKGGAQRSVIFDLEELKNWLSTEAGLDMKDPAIEKQAAALAGLFKRHSLYAPENIEAFQPHVRNMTDFISSGWEPVASAPIPNNLLPGILLGALALVLYVLSFGWIKQDAVRATMVRGGISPPVSVPVPATPKVDTKNPFRWESWWFSRSHGAQKLMNVALGVTVAVSVIAFLSFNVKSTQTADHSGVPRNLRDVTIGLGDPWFYILHHQTGTRGGFKSGVNLVAGSALFGYAALFGILASLRLSREQKRRKALPDASTDTPQRKFFWSAVASAGLFVAGIGSVIVHEARKEAGGGLLADAVHEVHPDFNRPGITSLAMKKEIADVLKLTPEQLEKVNAALNRAYFDFLKLENEHSEYRSENGHLVKLIKPFPDRSFDLAQKLATELRGIAGQPIIDDPERNAVWKLRLFRHAGEFEVRAELWEKEGTFHRDETWMRDGKKVMGGKSGDTLTDMQLAFGHYVLDWEMQKDILHEPRPADATTSHTLGADVVPFFVERLCNSELARLLAVKDPDTVVKSGNPHAALVTQAGTDLGRACAETELKRHGIPLAKDATPEVLITKLEALLGKPQP